jgi:predicted metal-dependent HD superfamily phosphohydrolase
MAFWFHDAVYDVLANDNEERSADWAEEELLVAGVFHERTLRVKTLILATRHSSPPESPDQQFFVDIDLAILGAPVERFNEYESQIREEYRWVPDPLYREKRSDILRQFLARTPIYHTPALRDALESRARENLSAAINRL